MSERIDKFFNGNLDGLQKSAVTFAQLFAKLAMDPHGYFEKKYTARIENATSENEIRSVLTQLLQWAVSSEIAASERERLESELEDHGLPSLDELRAHLLM